jgi:hypothetical protein
MVVNKAYLLAGQAIGRTAGSFFENMAVAGYCNTDTLMGKNQNGRPYIVHLLH